MSTTLKSRQQLNNFYMIITIKVGDVGSRGMYF